MWPIVVCLMSLFVIGVSQWVHRWRNPRCKGKLPPGSMGLPILGETRAFFSTYYSDDIQPFVVERMRRYGPIFKTNLVGQPIVISTDSRLNHFIFQQEGRLFQSWYPQTLVDIFGRDSVGELHGFLFKYIKSLAMSLIGIDSLKQKFLPEMNELAIQYLLSWSTQPSIDVKEATSDMIFDLAAKKLISYDSTKSSEKLRENFNAFFEGCISFPINIPGFTFYKCMQARKNVMRLLKRMLDERRASSEKSHGDYLDHVIEELKKKDNLLTEGIALDLIFVLLFASYETTSLALTTAFKLLIDNPQVLEKLTEEHEKLVKKRKDKCLDITWEEYKSMTYTIQVINETVRLANIIPAIFRKAMEDIKIQGGYTIPKGWGVMVCPPTAHLNPAMYEDPLSFDPSRWEGRDTNGGSESFMAFGGGVRFCIGADYSRLQMAVFLHHLVTKYRWIAIKGGETARTPGLTFPNGLHIQLFKKDKE